jgi:hypothetical protein
MFLAKLRSYEHVAGSWALYLVANEFATADANAIDT